MERLNQFASKFLFHVKEIPKIEEPKSRNGSSEHLLYVDWSDKITSKPIISEELNFDNSISEIYKTIEGKRYGFDDSVYTNFLKFPSLISSLPCFKNQASERFILDETFSWVVDSFKANRIQLVLFSYLQNRIEEKTEISTYEVIGDNEKLI